MVDQPSNSTGDTSNTPTGSSESSASRSGPFNLGGVVTIGALAVVLAVGTYALFRLENWPNGSGDTSQRFQLDLAAQMEIPAELLVYAEQQRFDVTLQDPVAIAVGPDGTIYVAGDSHIERIPANGAVKRIDLDGAPTCLTVGHSKSADAPCLYVGVGRHVVVVSTAGDTIAQWPDADTKSVFTGIVVVREHVFVADAGQRVVLHYDTDGKLLGTIGKPDPERQMPGFVIPSPYFDLVVDNDDMLHVVNPGMRRIETYDFEGQLQSYWGRAGSALRDFFGCCNPAHLALLPDGRFVTAEKGIPRIKVYSPTGDLECVVAGPKQLGIRAAALGDARADQKEKVFDVAVDKEGNVLALAPQVRQVIVFAPQTERDVSTD